MNPLVAGAVLVFLERQEHCEGLAVVVVWIEEDKGEPQSVSSLAINS